ncbi:MAG: DUF2306 domain-containing protein [Gemmatimonadota bacterium]
MTQRLTLAASSGLPLLSLAFHVAMGVIALVTGYVAIATRKGSPWHRRAGLVFVCTMIATGLTAGAISIYEGKPFGGGFLTAYLVFTAYTALRPLPAFGRAIEIVLLVLVSIATYGMFRNGMTALGNPNGTLDGVPAGMLFFLGSVFLLAAIGDVRVLRAGGIQGSKRIARHFWRVCFGLFIASGSFVAQLVKMPFMPAQLRSVPVIVLLGGAPLVVLLYWMWRIRLRHNLRGLMTKPIEAPFVPIA